MTLENLREHFIKQYMKIGSEYYYEGSDIATAHEEAIRWADKQIEIVKEVYES